MSDGTVNKESSLASIQSYLQADPFRPLSFWGLDQHWLDANRSALIKLLDTNKYWINTLSPLISSGHMKAIINDEYAYPHRIGIFPGLSCMFYCGFCGRNKNASYDRASVDQGIAIYKDLMSDAPKTGHGWRDRFRISGGQEPLTNPRLGELISHGHALGLNMGLYTNAYMLTTKYLQRQPGLLDLDYLRVSLYGYDRASYEHTTKRQSSWQVVRDNMISWAHHDGTQHTRLGVNWIILPGKVDDLLLLIQALQHLQDDMRRPLDFITLREDFSQDLIYINEAERSRLIEVLAQVKEHVSKHMPTTQVDYGYALEPLTRGISVGPLRMANHTQLDGKGLPQASVQVDVLGNVYAYHETAFLDRPGSDRFIIGNAANGMDHVVKSHLSSDQRFNHVPSDTEMLDAFDHAVTLAVWAARQDIKAGFTSPLWQ